MIRVLSRIILLITTRLTWMSSWRMKTRVRPPGFSSPSLRGYLKPGAISWQGLPCLWSKNYELTGTNIFTVVTVSTPALNIKMELTLISCGVSSPFMMRYVNRGIATVQGDINNPKIRLNSQGRQRDNRVLPNQSLSQLSCIRYDSAISMQITGQPRIES